MLILMIRLICAAYCLLLTTLLLVPDPWAIFGLRRIPGDSSGVSVHLMCFALLGMLVPASRLPLRREVLAALLIAYAITTELLQSPLGRDTALGDLVANLLGLAAGTAIWWIVRKHVRRTRRGEE